MRKPGYWIINPDYCCDVWSSRLLSLSK